MSILSFKTDLKSLRFGSDRPDGGSSNQPFITKPIPDDRKPAVISDGGPDFLLRGGILAPLRAVENSLRISKLFIQTPQGVQFLAKQNLLSRMSVKTVATQGVGYAGGNINQGAYLPTSTLLQLASPTGTHLNLLGLNPASPGQDNSSLLAQLGGGLVGYEKAILGISGTGESILGGLISPLSGLYEDKILLKTPGPNVYSYQGGPGADLGIGNTNIRFSSISLGQNRTGINNPLYVDNHDFFMVGSRPNSRTVDDIILSTFAEKEPLGQTNYKTLLNATDSFIAKLNNSNGFGWDNLSGQRAYEPDSLEPNTDPNFLLANSKSLSDTEASDFKNPQGTNYANIVGFGGNDGAYTDDLSSDGDKTWVNTSINQVYKSGSLEFFSGGVTTSSRKQTTEDWVDPLPSLKTPSGPTSYETLLNDTSYNGSGISSDGGVSWTQQGINSTTTKDGDTALNFNNNSVEITNRYKNIQFTSTQDSSSPLTNFRGLPIPLLAPISNGFNTLNNVFGTMPIDFAINAGVGQSVYKNSIEFGLDGSDAIETNVEFIQETGNGVATWTQGDFESITESELYPQTQAIRDFRKDILELDLPADSTKKVLSRFNGDYNTKRIDLRTNVGDAGARRNVQNYSVGGQLALDAINASDIYESPQATHTGTKNDLVKFSIGYIQNNNSGNSWFMNFRALISSFSDAYTADWGETQYVGRGDKFYNYKGFGRSISMGFNVYATSKAELIPMYKKLNFLASGLAPTYSSGGFMQGNLTRMTVGGYLYNQLGFIKSLTYTIPQSSTWEIAIDNNGDSDSTVKELPHMIEVTGFTFQPIQEFVPRIGNPKDLGETPYIALSNGENTNY
tara:strand:+ start:354 stop:2894 length:2541 start_codon:yes stop_codon:yes gene_type:complete